MRKVLSVCVAVLTAIVVMTGCGSAKQENPMEGTLGKVAVNIEGTISAVDGDEITLDNGKVVVISKDTVFAGDPDTNSQVSNEFAVGNFIQGYTSENPDAEKVTATNIYINEAPMTTGGKIVINYEGTVASANENGVVLDNGQVVGFDENTVFTDVNGTVGQPELKAGSYIQGYTEDDAAATEITAKRVHIVVY